MYFGKITGLSKPFYMNKTLLTLLSIGVLCLAISCKKKKKDDLTPTQSTAVDPYGHFYAMLIDVAFVYQDSVSGPDTLMAGTYHEVAVMIHSVPTNPRGMSLDAGDVSLNGIQLAHAMSDEDTNAYLSDFSTDPYYFINGTSWIVTGKGTVPAMTYNDTRKHPDYTGPVPDVIERVKGLTMTFDISNVTNADSVTIAFGVDSMNRYLFSKTFASNVGVATITPQELSTLTAGEYGIIIAPFTYSTRYFANNPYAFIREKRIERYAILK